MSKLSSPSFAVVLSALLVAGGMTACGGTQSAPPAQAVAAAPAQTGPQYPEWVMKGAGASTRDGKKVFVGVGSASGIKNQGLANTTADNRARAEISKVFEVYSASLMKDYMASTTAGDMSASSEEQHVEQAIKTFSANTMSGVQIADRWFHPDGTIYSLAILDLEMLTNGLPNMKDLSAQVKDYVKKNAENTHNALEAEAEKRSN